MIDAKQLNTDYEIICDAWQFLKQWSTSTRQDWNNAMDADFLRLYRKHNGPKIDFAHKILDAVLGEVLAQHEDGGEDQ